MKLAHLFLVIFLIFGLSDAAILNVATGGSQIYTQIQPAINASNSGDTLLVFPGSYDGFTVDRHLVIIGAGTSTTGEGTKIVGVVEVNDAADSTELRSVWIQTGANGTQDSTSSSLVIHSGAIGILVWRCFLESTPSVSVRCAWAGDGTSTQWVQSIFWTSGGGYNGLYVKSNSSAILTSCVFSNIGTGIVGLSGTTVIARHCVFCNSASGALYQFASTTYGSAVNCAFMLGGASTAYPASMDFAYCAYHTSGNIPIGSTNFATTSASFQNIVLANPRISDYHLSPSSNLRDTGNPNDPPDLDGSRADIGIYGGQHPFVDGGIPDYPFMIRLEAPYTVPQNGVMKIWARGVVGPGY